MSKAKHDKSSESESQSTSGGADALMLRDFILPLFLTVIGGGSLFLIIAIAESNPPGATIDANPAQNVEPLYGIPGQWFGLHITEDSRGRVVLSRHWYELTVDSTGRIEGQLRDSSSAGIREYALSGSVNQGRLVITDTNPHDASAFALEVYENSPGDTLELRGMIVGYNYNRNLFVSPSLLRKIGPVPDTAFINFVESAEPWMFGRDDLKAMRLGARR